MRVCLMIEGQEDVSWEAWVAVAGACEQAGLDALFRSDHYRSVMGRAERGSLDAWATIAGLSAVTERIRLGTLVSPATFRHPSVLAKMAVGFSFAGTHYTVTGLNALPKPVQRPHLPLIVGGRAGPQSAALAARWADEYNTVFASPEVCRKRRLRLERAFEEAGRNDLRFSLMTGCIVGVGGREVERRVRAVMDRSGQSGDVLAWVGSHTSEWVIGTVGEVVDRLGELEEAGVERVMLQHLCHDDLDMVHLLGSEVAPRVA